MVKLSFLLTALLFTTITMSQHLVRFNIKTLPSYHSSGSDIYAAGSFNGWNPQDSNYKFHSDSNGQYTLSIKLAKGTYEYKITRGSWGNAECKKDGAAVANRQLKVETAITEDLVIEEWQDRFPAPAKKSTASKNVHIIDTAFLIPQLKRTRRIWVYLPEGYNNNTKTRYPVMYMHDGQNVFDESTAYSGEWGVDDFLDSTQLKKCIVVAIDNGGVKRMNEYNPYNNTRFGKGEGGKYVDFLVKTLKPYIDKRYRTIKTKAGTSVAGSSMGGLISLYAVLKYPAVFGSAGVFSPAFWISGKKIFTDIKTKGSKVKARIYFYGGKQEGETMVPDMLKAFETMAAVSTSVMTTVIRDEGKHNEANWRNEFPLFYKWIKFD